MRRYLKKVKLGVIYPYFAVVAITGGILSIDTAAPDYWSEAQGTIAWALDRIDEPEWTDLERTAGTSEDITGRSQFEIFRLRSPKTGMIPQNIRSVELDYAARLPKMDALRNPNARGKAVTFDFTSRGPRNIGGRTRAVAVDISDDTEQTILAGGVSGGMWKTTDLGVNWVRTTTANQFPSVVSLMQDTRPGRTNEWYVGTGEIRGNSADGSGGAFYRGDGIYKSTDGGDSWSILPTTSTGDITTTDNVFRFINNLAIDTTNATEDEVYAAVIDGIIRSTDGFETYSFVLGSPDNTSLYTDVATTSTGRVYATISDNGTDFNEDFGIWRSDDGINWTEITLPDGVPTSGFQRTTIGISPSDESVVYFFRTEKSGEDYNLFVYDADEDELVARPPEALPVGLNTQGSYDQYVKVYPTDPNIVFLGGVDLYRSTNGFADGSTNQEIGGSQLGPSRGILYINHHVDQHDMVFFPSDPRRVVTANDGGLAITDDILKSTVTLDSFEDPFFNETVSDSVTVEWEELNDRYVTSQFHAMAISQEIKGFPWISGGLQDNSTVLSDNDDENEFWGTLFGGDGAFTAITPNSLIVSAQYAQLLRFSILDDGTDTDIAYPPNAGNEDSALFIAPFIADPVVPNKVFVSGRGAIYSTYDITQNPNGDDWFALGESELSGDEFITAFSASVADNNQLLAGTFDIGTGKSRILRIANTDEPLPLEDITGSNLPDGYINSIKIDPRNANRITVVYSNYDLISVWQSENGGATWFPIAGNLEENSDGSGAGPSIRWIEIMPNGSENIYLLGTSTGLYFTETLDGMSTVWQQAGATTIGNVVIDQLAVRTIDGYLVVSTHGKGVYQAFLDVPMQPKIYLESFPCQGESYTIFANQEFSTSDLTYEWLVDGELIPGLSGPGITGQSLDQTLTVQARVSNASTGNTVLSNLLVVRPRNNIYCASTQVLGASNNQLESIQLYPNPASNYISISGVNNLQTPYVIYDAKGVVVQKGILSTQMNVSDLKPGTYLFAFDDKTGKRITRRFVKK